MKKLLSSVVIVMLFAGCGGTVTTTNNNSTNQTYGNDNNNTDGQESINSYSYKGLRFYYQPMEKEAYKLEPLSDSDFNSLTREHKLQVSNKLLNSLFWGYSLKELNTKIDSGTFLSDTYELLGKDITDKEWLENEINDESKYFKHDLIKEVNIFTRFYAFKSLDKYYLDNYISYILTQTILFSPAFELQTVHRADVSQVYNHLVLMQQNKSGMRYITYIHMMSQSNWRRFRSPEDNGREMLEIYTLNSKDSDVPLAAKALQNWKLSRDGETLDVGLNQNKTPIKLFNTTIYSGEDFYRELAKSNEFTIGATTRLVNYYFPEYSSAKKADIVSKIVSSKPETWQDIILQILFSKEYLLHNHRVQTLEETFFSMAKKMKFYNKTRTFIDLRYYLDYAHQSSMKYKLGKTEAVPLDGLSFAYYHKYVRNTILLNVHIDGETDRASYKYDGWDAKILSTNNFTYDASDDVATLNSFVNYLFNLTIARDATDEEQNMFKNHMIENKNGKELFKNAFNISITPDDESKTAMEQEKRRLYIARIVLDYVSRLSDVYTQKEIK